MRNILITGGAGFIGTNLVKHMVWKYPEYKIVVLDAFTYAGDPENLREVIDNIEIVHGNICDTYLVKHILSKFKIDSIMHLAAESHVDRSISDPYTFADTNVMGTITLLNEARLYWQSEAGRGRTHLFHHISTDEVYGSIDEGFFTEENPIDPRSPYSASKASSDLFVLASHNTYKLPVVITRCSNNYGEYQYPEKLLPLLINNVFENKSIPVYGDGKNVRDWLYVGDHCSALDLVFHKGKVGEVYNVGGNCEMHNIDIIHKVCDLLDKKTNRKTKASELITYVTDRAGHDRRYAIDSTKLKQLGWRSIIDIDSGLELTVDWYIKNQLWLKNKLQGEQYNRK